MAPYYKHTLFFLLYLIADGLSSTYLKTSRLQTPNASSDAELLKNALDSSHTSAIVSILTNRSYDQRLDIALQFKLKYGKILEKELETHVEDKEVRNLLVALVLPIPVFYARQLHEAVAGFGTNENILIDILCTLSSNEIWSVNKTYELEFHQQLVNDIKGDTSGDFRHLLISLLTVRRDEGRTVHDVQAVADARKLHGAGVGRIGTDESVFYEILCSRSYYHLREVFDEYKDLSGHEIEDAIAKEFSGDAKNGLLALVATTRNLPEYFAKRLDKWMSGADKGSGQLTRIVVARSGVDMDDIKREYITVYHVPLQSDIFAHTEGLYTDALFNLIGLY
ncbi:hypothetical protein RI129_005732 [Pyrocoelia pectoralis]|uniref:Annexin n=1 Tax=Pyrocoelia pectoralis TaxID=417401 RepID=A0AAN7ZHP8_9COLE